MDPDDLSPAKICRLRRLLFVFLWRELRTSADREPRELWAIRLAKRAVGEKYRKALPKLER